MIKGSPLMGFFWHKILILWVFFAFLAEKKLIFESQINKIGNLSIWIVKKLKNLKGCVEDFFGGF